MTPSYRPSPTGDTEVAAKKGLVTNRDGGRRATGCQPGRRPIILPGQDGKVLDYRRAGRQWAPIGWGWFPEDKRGSVNIVVSNVKGGVGKTTTTIYLAAAAVARGWDPVLVVDADRQASSAEWLEARPTGGIELVEGPSERTV